MPIHLLVPPPFLSFLTPFTHLLKSPQCVKNATIVFFPPAPDGKASPRVVGRPVAALKTVLCFSKEYSGEAGSDFMMENGEDCRMMRPRGLVVVGPAEEGCCVLSWPEPGGWWGKTKAWQHVVAARAATNRASFERQRAML